MPSDRTTLDDVPERSNASVPHGITSSSISALRSGHGVWSASTAGIRHGELPLRLAGGQTGCEVTAAEGIIGCKLPCGARQRCRFDPCLLP